MNNLQKAARNGGTALDVVRISKTTPADEHIVTAKRRHVAIIIGDGLLEPIILSTGGLKMWKIKCSLSVQYVFSETPHLIPF